MFPSWILRPHPDNGTGDSGGTGGAGGAGTAPANTTGGPPQSAVERASADARARIAATGTALPADASTGAAKPTDEQVRASDGTFAPKLPAEIEAENAAKAAKADAAAKATEGKTPEQIAAEQKAATDAAAERTPEQIAAADADAAAARTVEIALNDGTALPVEFDDPAIAEQVRERFEVAARTDEIRQQAQRQIDDVMLVRESVNVDPVGFVLGEVGNQPAAIEHLVLSLLTQESAKDLLAKVAKIVADPAELRIVAAEQKAQRSVYKEEATTRFTEARAVQQNLQDVQTACAAMLPRDMTPEQQRVLYADMLRDVQHYSTRHNLTTIEIQDIPLVLRSRLTAHGVDPVAAAEQVAAALAARKAGRRVAPPARNGTNGTNGTKTAPKTGSAFVASAERRKTVVVPGGGAGSPGAGVDDLTPPTNPDGTPHTTEQRLAWHRARLAKGVKSFG